MIMKGKLRTVWQVGLALILASSLGLVIAAPIAASPDVDSVQVSVTPPTAGSPAEYEIRFTPNKGLSYPENVIFITFPPETPVPLNMNINDITVEDVGFAGPDTPSQMEVNGQTVTIWLPDGVDIGFIHTGKVVFALGAGLVNPAVPDIYCLEVSTDIEPEPVTGCYQITTGPVDVYLKYQVPLEDCGYIELEHVQSFETIQGGLDKANELFLDMYSPTPTPSDLGLYVEYPEDGGYVGIKVIVQPGTYNETIVIDTPGVELCSADGAATTIIDANGLSPWGPENVVVFITSGGVTFGGMDHGFTVMNGGLNRFYWNASWPNDDGDDNIDTFGIALRSHGSDKSQSALADAPTSAVDARVNILDNIVNNNEASGIAIWGGCVLVNGNDVYDNDWDGFYGNDLFVGVEIYDPESFTGGHHASSEIIYNQFYSNDRDGVEIVNAHEGSINSMDGITTDLYIVGNDIHDNGDSGIKLKEGATGEGNSTIIAIKFNQIAVNDIGINTAAMYPTFNIACVYNNIWGNIDWGIKNWDEDPLIAKMNWWGDLSGPSDGTAPVHPSWDNPDQTAFPPAMGRGDAVSHHVIYQWWLTWPFENVQTDLVRHYGSDRYQGMGNDPYDIPWSAIIPLKEGWNTLSTPMALDQRADQLGEIAGMGDWLQNMMIGYSYDPIGGWQLLAPDFQFVPLEAVYVKINGPEKFDEWMGKSYADLFPILLRGSILLPQRNLEPGWNLVGLNADIWNEEYDGCIWRLPVQQTLSSVSGSWSNAISPSMPGQIDSWVYTPTTEGDFFMYTGDGYWVFITEPATLAGFSIAPWYLNEWEMEILNCKIPRMPF